MITIPAYFDGNAVRTLKDYKFEKGQQLTISVQEEDNDDFGGLYIPSEKKALFDAIGKIHVDAQAVKELRERDMI